MALVVRRERPEDKREIAEAVTAAFGDASVAEFTESIRASAGYLPDLGLERPDERTPDEAWLALPLSSYEPGIRGRVVYPPFFPGPPGA